MVEVLQFVHPILRVGDLVWSQHKADAIPTLLSMLPKARVGGDNAVSSLLLLA